MITSARCPVSQDCQALQTGRVALFPASRPRRERPQREARLLLVENGAGEVLFERRPPAGIWGGLWCLPLIDGDGEAAPWLRQHYGQPAELVAELASFSHAFTHFELRLIPLRLRALPGAQAVNESRQTRWIHPGAELPGLPTPVSRFLAGLHDP